MFTIFSSFIGSAILLIFFIVLIVHGWVNYDSGNRNGGGCPFDRAAKNTEAPCFFEGVGCKCAGKIGCIRYTPKK
jgi:hypothetical protein